VQSAATTTFVLGAGTYAAGAVQVRQTDLAGNITTTPSQNAAAISIDTTAPSLTQILGSPQGLDVKLDFTFNESVTGFDDWLTDVILLWDNAGIATLGSLTGGGASYSLVVTPPAGATSVVVDVNHSTGGITDTAGNALLDFTPSYTYGPPL
jgi:hypothetical protein